MSETIELSRVIPARPERVFNAWLDADEHGQMTGGEPATVGADGAYTAYDGYISGRTLEQHPHSRIVQSWRSTEFPDGAPDSRLEVLLEEAPGGTMVTLRHSDIPDGQGESYRQGWVDHYFDPMTAYFQSARSRIREAGEVISDAAHDATEKVQALAEQTADAMEGVGDTAQKAVRQVQKTAARAAKTVKTLVDQAKKKLAARKKKKPAARKAKAAPKRKAAPAKKKAKAKPKAKTAGRAKKSR
jgi:uncharacterized protein YndB with AHSA1/START domain